MNPNNMKPKRKNRKKNIFSPKRVKMAPKVHKETEKITRGSFVGKRWFPYDM
jgi:hypothetical protein